MISKPTTLVLGAGASIPYGFPSGAGLRKLLCDVNYLAPLYAPRGRFTRAEVEEFAFSFLRSGLESIDAFLSRRGKDRLSSAPSTIFSDVGKLAIAFALVQCEVSENLFSSENEDGWYQYLWRYIGDSLENFGKNISIVTFNYDRSLEVYLISALMHAYGLTEEKALQHLKKLNIIHVYGQLGELPGVGANSAKIRSYSPKTDIEHLTKAADGIKVIAESRDDEELFVGVYEALNGAEKICFLGFGFDQTNVERLKIKQILTDQFLKRNFRGPMTYATTIGLKRAERFSIIKLLGPDYTNIHTHSPAEQNNYMHLEANIRDGISSNADEKNMNFLRHTGVFSGA